MSESRDREEPEVVPHEAGVPQEVAPPLDEPADESAPDGAARPSVAPRPYGWRDEALGTALVCAVIGIWLVFSPEALGYGQGDATWSPVVCGVLIAFFSIVRAIGRWSSRVLPLITFVIGAWLFVSAIILEAPPGGKLNQAGFGAIVALLSLIGLAGSQRGHELNPD